MEPQLTLFQSLKLYSIYFAYFALKGLLPVVACSSLLIYGVKALSIPSGDYICGIIILVLCIYVGIFAHRRFLYQSIIRPYSDFKITTSAPALPWNVFIYFLILQAVGPLIISFVSAILEVSAGFFGQMLKMNFENFKGFFDLTLAGIGLFAQVWWCAYVVQLMLRRYSHIFQVHVT